MFDRLEQILREYRIAEDPGGTCAFDVSSFPDECAGLTVPPQDLTRTEIDMLVADPARIRPLWDIKVRASAEALARFPPPDGGDVDNRTDAFRHGYGSALMTRAFGAHWTRSFTDAHEGIPANPRAGAAMDLYNNEVGRHVALADPDACAEELADRVAELVENGDMVVVRPDGQGLAWSDVAASPEF